MDKSKTVTIKDVARAANVSIATVSRIIGGSTDFSPETRKLIWDTVHALHYEPNRQARMLRSGNSANDKHVRTNLIMRVFHIGRNDPLGYPITAESMQMFSWLAQRRGLFTTFYSYNELEGFCCPPLLDHLIDGVVVGVPHKDVISAISKKVPVVALNVNNGYRDPNIVMVNPAIESGLAELLEQVRELGHHHAAVVGAKDSDHVYSGNYCRTISRLLSETGFHLLPEHIFQTAVHPENHEEKMAEMVNSLVPAIKTGNVTLVAAADLCYAETICRMLRQKGIRIPEDVSLISLNSVRGLGTPLESDITNIGHDWVSMNTASIEVLEKLINGEKPFCSEYLVNTIYNQGKTLDKVRSNERL